MKTNPRGWIDGRDLCLYAGLLSLGVGLGIWWDAGAGLAAVGLVLIRLGVSGLPKLKG